MSENPEKYYKNTNRVGTKNRKPLSDITNVVYLDLYDNEK